jgi:putative nucleotidyltransferase with HDIG domain
MAREVTKETVLFVDDEESILDIARTYFTSRGYQVMTASNGREAIDRIWNNRIDCCFTDINMPEMDGLELAEYIRNHDNTVPVVVMTGYPSLDNTIQTLKNGVVDFLIKPINLRQMEICVQRVLRERKLFIENIILSKEVQGKAKLEKLNAELIDKNRELNIINRIMTDFSNLHESADVFKRLVDSSVQLAHADGACFYLLNESTDQAMPIAYAKAPELDLAGEPQDQRNARDLDRPAALADDPKIRALIFDVAKDDRPLLIRENNGSGSLPAEIRSFMLTPLKIRNKLLGVLSASVSQGRCRFGEKDLYHLSFMANKAASAMESLALYENIYNNLLATLYAFVKAIEARDPYTKQHSNRVTRLSLAIAEAMDCTNEEQEILNVAGLLHDIGKIGIRDEILLKPGRLTSEEFDIIKQHPVIGAEIMDNVGLWHREKQIVRCHHERFDGQGYPDRLKGRQIPLLARILSVADVYDAIASDRAYRRRMEESKILNIIYGGAGSQFDPEIINIFRSMYESGQVAQVAAEAD